jgi:hypothetical protein
MKWRILLVLLAFNLCSVPGGFGQTQKPLTNAEVINMTKQGLGHSVPPNAQHSIDRLDAAGWNAKEAQFVKSLWFRGEWADDVIFAMLASDWKRAKTT